MEPDRWAVIESLYHSALERDPAERSCWLQQMCGNDALLLDELTSLLTCADANLSNIGARQQMAKLWARAGAEVDSDEANSSRAASESVSENILPRLIGHYRVLRLVGEGGMGVVYEAEQEQPRRVVALKVIKPGLGDPELFRRFEHESLVLGRLQHPGIAQVYEAGTADTEFVRLPYFAMEFIHGQPLLEYAAAQHLSVRAKLELIAKVCDAVQHAHQRGIIHRDLKPGNILVDETGQPKILDFGVARATNLDTRATRQTDIGQLVGTLAYMSPEQVLADPLELDTRSDVYSLGVVLYELLSGELPYKISNKLHEAVRTIHEEEPKSLSSLNSTYRGEIATIVQKVLEKDKSRRYESASELASDIRHYLRDEPLSAHPPSAIYQLQKFASRHRSVVLAVASVFTVLIAGTIVSARQAARANAEAAASRAIGDFLQHDLLAQASAASQSGPKTKPDPDLKVRTALDRAAARITGKFDRQPQVEAAIRRTMGETYLDLGLYGEARAQLQRAVDLQRRVLGSDNAETLKTMNRLGFATHLQGKNPEAEAILLRTLDLQRRTLGSGHTDTLSSMDLLGTVYWAQGKYPQAETIHSQALQLQRRVLGPENPETLNSMTNLALDYDEEGKYLEAEPLLSEDLAIRRRVLGAEHPNTLNVMNNLANIYWAEGKYQEAEVLHRQTLQVRTRLLGPEHPNTLSSMTNLANVYFDEGKYEEYAALDSRALEIQRRVLGPEHPETLKSMNNLAAGYYSLGKYIQGEDLASQCLEIRTRVLGPEHRYTLKAMENLAVIYTAESKYKQADALFKKCLEARRRVLGADHPDSINTLSGIAALYQRQGRYGLAESYAVDALSRQRRASGSESHATVASDADDLALAYQCQGKFTEAEPLAREGLDLIRKSQPDDWQRYRSESELGASLAGQGKYAEAEPLLVDGYQGMFARKDRIAVPDRYYLNLAYDWTVQLYTSWQKPYKAAEWRSKYSKLRF